VTVDIRPIRNDKDHAAALAEMATLWKARKGSPEYDRLDILATLVDVYEAARWPIESADPVEAIKAAMAFEGHTQEDLANVIGANRASEVLHRKRHLTLSMIRKLTAAWHIPPERLIGEYELRAG
jgi:antitoxin component HigA of HigAB toxin-antitoxin module